MHSPRRLLLGLLPLLAFAVARPASASGEQVGAALDTFDVPPGATVTITFQVTVDSPLNVCATAVSNQGTLTGANFSDVDTDDPDVGGMSDPTLTPLDVADLAVTKDDGQTTAVPGEMVTYTITVTNGGPSDVVGATVADPFPAALTGVTWTCIASAGSSCTAGPVAGDVNDVVTVLAGGTLSYTATGTVAAGATGSLVNTATVTPPAGTTDCATGNNSATDTDTLAPEADLAIAKDDGQTTAVPGEPVTYTITVTNGGPSDAVGATVADPFPATLAGVSWTCVASAGSSCTAGPVAGDVNDVVTVLAGGTLSYTATGTIDPGATGSLANTATVSAPGGTTDPNGANDSSTDTDTLEPEADLAVTKVDDADPPAPGANFVYTITVDNLGPSDATGVVATDNLPAGVTLVATFGCAEDPAGVPTCTLGSIPAGDSASYTIEVSIDDPPPASVSNTASAAGGQPDPVSGNDSDTEETTFDAEPPEVDGVDSVAGTGDGQLDECETALASLTRLLVSFDEEVAHAAAGDPESATNPSNYRLVRPAGPGSGFDTATCAGGTGGDTVVPIDAVAYDDGSDTATLEVNGGASLADGLYRLLVCGTIEDPAGNPLDGGAGAGTDFDRTFRVDRANRLAGGHFDDFDPVACTLDDWSSTSPASVELSPPDSDGSPLSASAHNAGALVGFDLSQCVAASGGQELELRARLRVAAAAGVSLSFDRTCRFFSAAACGGSTLGVASFADAVEATAGAFLDFVNELTAPAGTAAVRCGFAVDSPGGQPFEAYLDQTFLGADDLIFTDGFESGDLSAWSLTVP